jgi:hypothetical protein
MYMIRFTSQFALFSAASIIMDTHPIYGCLELGLSLQKKLSFLSSTCFLALENIELLC